MEPVTLLEIETERVRFPAACAACDGPVAAVAKLPITRGVDLIVASFTRSLALDLPLCATCHRRLFARRVGGWMITVALSLGVPFGLLAIGASRDADSALGAPLAAAVVVWFVGGLWWLRNRAAQAIARRTLPAWIEDADRHLSRLTLGVRRASLARDVATLSGLSSSGVVVHEHSGYRDPAAHVPEAFVRPERAGMSWWWFLVMGAVVIAGAVAQYAELAAHERDGRPVSLHVLFAAIYQLFGKVGVAGVMGATGVGLLVLAFKVRAKQRELVEDAGAAKETDV